MRKFFVLAAIGLCAACISLAQTPTLIQHVSGSGTLHELVSAGGSYNIPLPNATLAGNALICAFQLDNTTPPVVNVTDDKSNAWTLGASVTDTTHKAVSAIYYALNVAPGTTVVHVNVMGNSADFVSAVVSEFNNVAAAGAFDGSSGSFATGTSISSGSFTTSTPGDLIYQYASGDSGSGTSWSQGSTPWNLLSADYSGSQAAQFQVQASAGAINPTLAISPITAWGSVAIALKSASAGTALPSGIRVLRLVHFNTRDETSGVVKFQFPTLSGNLIVMAFSSGAYYPTSITDSKNNNFTYTGGVLTSDPCVKIFHAASASGDPALVVTANMTGNVPSGAGGTFFAYEIGGAAPNPLDTGFGTSGFAGASGNQDRTFGSGPVTTFTATPSAQNELIIVVGSMAADTATGWSSPSGAQQIPTTFTGELNPTNSDENNPAGLFYVGANKAPETWTFTHDTLNNPGVGNWAVAGAAFQDPPPGVTPPTTPTNLTATVVSSSQINLSWTASTDPAGVTGYTIELCQGIGCTSFGPIATQVGTATTYSDAGLSPSTSYSYRVRAMNSAGNVSGYSNVASATTLSGGPTFTAPKNLSATAAGNTQINLAWTAATETGGTISQYLIERCATSGCSNFAQVGTSATTSFNDTGLAAGASYSYRVRATDAANNFSPYSNVASATTPSTSPPPSTISLIQVNSADPQTSLSTIAVPYTAAQRVGDLNVVVVGWNDSAATGSTVTDTMGNVYLLAVGPTVQGGTATQSIYYAKNIVAAGAGANSVTVGFNGSAAFPDIRILEYSGLDASNPLDVTAAAVGNSTASNSGAVTTTNANDLLIGANVVQSGTIGAGAGFTKRIITNPDGDIAEDQVVSAIGSYSATAPVSPSGQWIMQMVAFKAAGSVPPSPTAPSNLTATAGGSTEMVLSWTASSEPGGTIASYLIERCPGATCSNFAQVGTSTTTTFTDTGLLGSTTYSYRIRAMDSTNNTGPYSNTASATTAAPTLAAPSNLAATPASSTQINLSWTNNATNQTGFKVERSPDNVAFTKIATTGAATTSFSDNSLAPLTTYYYRVRATNGTKDSAYSNMAKATTPADTTPPTAPANLTATAVSSTQINLFWTAATDNVGVTQYQVQRCRGAGCASFALAGTSATPSYPDTGLLAATSYSYQLRALDGAGNASAFSNIATTVTQSAAPPPPVTLVQHTETSVSSGINTISQTFPTASVSGDLILVTAKWGNQALSVSSVADNKGNVYTSALGPTNWAGTLKSAQTFYAKNIAGSGAPITITVKLTGNSTSSIHLYQFEYTNIDPANPIDTTCASVGVGTSISCGPVNTSSSNDLLYAVAFNDNATTNAGSGFATLSTYHGNVVESVQTAAAGAYTATASNTSSTSWFMHSLAIKRHP